MCRRHVRGRPLPAARLYVISQKDILQEPEKDDPIAISSSPIDSHDGQRVALKGGDVINEGTILAVRRKNPKQGYAYHVPYRSILPRPEQCDNLLVPVALSCTHVGVDTVIQITNADTNGFVILDALQRMPIE